MAEKIDRLDDVMKMGELNNYARALTQLWIDCGNDSRSIHVRPIQG